MISVTFSAKEKLKNDLQDARRDEETLIRLAPSQWDLNRFGLYLDKEKEGDQIIEDNEGEKLLLIGHDIASTVTGAELDYQNTTEGAGFNLMGT